MKFNSIQIFVLFLERLDNLKEIVIKNLFPNILIHVNLNRKLLDDFFILLKKVNEINEEIIWECLNQFCKEKV